VIAQRQERFCLMVLAESLEGEGRFLADVESIATEIADQKTWVYPAHDRGERNFRGQEVAIDLFSSRCAWNFATALHLLGERLSPQVRERMEAELERRSFVPFERAIRGEGPRFNWLTRASNWNAVCLAGTVGSALATIESPQRRAWFVAAAEERYPHFLKSFSPDGYCLEGVGYWNYGFGHYVMLCETVRHGTGGKLDWMQHPVARAAASYPHRIHLTSSVYPPFGDCGITSQPGPATMGLLDRRRRLVEGAQLTPAEIADIAQSAEAFLASVGHIAWNTKAEPDLVSEIAESPLRGWFPEHVVLVCRPHPDNALSGIGLAVNGGHNDEPHNHNDVGSYVVSRGTQMPLIDPGAEVYTSRTFSSRRYESQVINSFGHPVPRVAGVLQSTGRRAKAVLVDQHFSDDEDRLSLDLRSAYAARELERLVRHFRFRREGKGELTVTDEFAFATPQEFETALITMSAWSEISPGELRIGNPGHEVRVSYRAEPAEAELVLEATVIEEDLGGEPLPTRIGLRFREPTVRGKIVIQITPDD
jgi:hypothetical protein